MSSTIDCRTRNNTYFKNASRRETSYAATVHGPTGGNANYNAASIFEHTRLPVPAVEGGVSHVTTVRYPSTFDEVEQWVDGLIDAALTAARSVPNQSSSIKVLFLDEKKCAKVFGEEFPMNRLNLKLKISDWRTSHYMSAFCRFPLPLDLDDDDDSGMHHAWDWQFSISHPFDWDMLWVYFPTTRTTLGVVRTWFDGYDTDFTQMENEIKDFEGPTLANPMLLGLLALQVLTSDAMANVREKGNLIYEAQITTGFHRYDRLRSLITDTSDDEQRLNDLGAVSRKVIGAACNMTGWENATRQLVKFAHFLQEHNRRWMASKFAPGTTDRPDRRLCMYVEQQSQKLVGDLDGAHHDLRAWLATANFLLMGVLNMLGQGDSKVNIELAKDQKRIAEETKRDSSSMMAIAVVTMFFLPGTFTASIFALPYFERSLEKKGLSQFWTYWVVTIALTIITLSAWTFYTKVWNPAVAEKAAPASTPQAEMAGEEVVKLEEDAEAQNQHSDSNQSHASMIQEWLVRSRHQNRPSSAGGPTRLGHTLGRLAGDRILRRRDETHTLSTYDRQI
ncbi:hypothetical protein VTK56DRAFT_4856 [Thermocarpiscus australiensis]